MAFFQPFAVKRRVMFQAVLDSDPPNPPDLKSAPSPSAAHETSRCARLLELKHTRMPARRSGVPPLAAPVADDLAHGPLPAPPRKPGPKLAGPSHAQAPREHLIASLRHALARIERPSLDVAMDGAMDGAVREPTQHTDIWNLAAPGIDVLLGPGGLDTAACHEIKPDTPQAAAQARALAFALALACRRQRTCAPESAMEARTRRPILLCTTRHIAHETGGLYGPGLLQLGLDPASVILVEATRARDVLWALEEGVASGAMCLAIGCLDTVALTPARRMSLAALKGRTPCLLLTGACSPAAGAMSTRWRIGPAPGTPHLLDRRAPGNSRLAVTLERCRMAPAAAGTRMLMEWSCEWSCKRSWESSHETHRFRMAAPLADREIEAEQSRIRSG